MTDPHQLHPDLLPLYEAWLADCLADALRVRLTHTWRSPAVQDALYARGRTTPGMIVTSLTGAKSKHCFTLGGKPAARAFDFGCFTADGTYITRGTHPDYALAGNIGERLGLRWGGRWAKPFDPGHLELI